MFSSSIFRAFFSASIAVVLFALLPAAGCSEAAAPGLVRVVLEREAESLSFKVTGNYQLVDQSTGESLFKLNQGEEWQVKLRGSQIELRGRQGCLGPFDGPVAVQEVHFHVGIISGNGEAVEKYSSGGLVVLGGEGRPALLNKVTIPSVSFAGGSAPLAGDGGLNLVSLSGSKGTRRYRGNMEFRVENGGLTAINELNIEDYLRGVVPAEMPSKWPLEALKAQAVAARNYAIQRVEVTRGSSYNVFSDRLSQVYGGYDAESPATNMAVEETRGVVMTCKGRLITAFFHSSSGGCIENSEDIWKDPLPYIKYKEDPYDKNDRHYNWQVDYTAEELAKQLKSYGYDFEKVADIKELERTSSGKRVKKILVTGRDSTGQPLQVEIFNADKVRFALGLKSAVFTMSKVYNEDKELSAVNIKGSGWGHGLGMSQWGARGMAEQGYNYQDILKYYYSDITLEPSYGRSPVS